jgi:hypothetical protein
LIVEASVAGQGQGDAGQGEAAQQQGPDMSALAEQIGNLTAGQEEMHQILRAEPWRAEAADGQEPDAQPEPELDLSQYLDPGDPQYDPAQLAEHLSDVVEKVVEQRLEPLRQETKEIRQEREWQAVADQFPELVDEQVARPVFALAKEMAEHNGHPELSQEPWFVRMVYTAGKALEAASEEGAESPSAAHLEGGGGAAPAGSQVDAMTQVFGAGEDQPLGRRALPFAG